MSKAKCPICGCEEFYVKDPDDEYETYGFECVDGKILFDSDVDGEHAPEVDKNMETYCNRCSWHDKLGSIDK